MLQSKDTEWQIGLKKKKKQKKLQYAAHKRPTIGDTHRLKVKGWKKDIYGNGKKTGFAILMIKQNEL